MMLLKRFRAPRRIAAFAARRSGGRTVSLPIHPCVELSHFVSGKLAMYWDGEITGEAGDALLGELYSDPATAALATEITNDELLLRSAFNMLSKAKELTAA